MILAIIGSRTITDINLSEYVKERPDEIVSGGANGIDTLAAIYARENNIPLKEFRPDYQKYGRGATHIRNRQIIDYCDKVLAIWDGKSKGTLSSLNYAKRIGKESVIVNPYNNEDIPIL